MRTLVEPAPKEDLEPRPTVSAVRATVDRAVRAGRFSPLEASQAVVAAWLRDVRSGT